MSFDPYNRLLKICESIETPTPKMGVHLGLWGFILLKFHTFLRVWNVIPKFQFWPFANPCFGHKPKVRVVTLQMHLLLMPLSLNHIMISYNYYWPTKWWIDKLQVNQHIKNAIQINGRLKNGIDLGLWSSGKDGYKIQEIGEKEAMEQDLKWPTINMENNE
jgi:hypothetical protein